MKLFRFFVMTLLMGAGLTTDVLAQQPVVDGLLWGTNPYTGQSAPSVLPNPAPNSRPHISAFGKLDKVKYNGYSTPGIGFDSTTLFMYVTPLDAQGQPIAAQMIQFKGTGENVDGTFAFNTSKKWDPTANGGMGDLVDFAGFPAGSYQIRVVAKIVLTTLEKQNPPPQPPTPASTVKRDAILLTSPFTVP